jgi:hypothetical protein
MSDVLRAAFEGGHAAGSAAPVDTTTMTAGETPPAASVEGSNEP